MRHTALREPVSPRLLRAYRMTRYCAGGIELRIGRPVPVALFSQVAGPVAVLITAWNPMSRRMPDGWNRRMQRRLRCRLRRSRVLDGDGSLRGWREPMLLVGGDPRRAIRLAIAFRQRAVVMVRRGQAARLRLTPSVMAGAGRPPTSCEQSCQRPVPRVMAGPCPGHRWRQCAATDGRHGGRP